jgi:4-amino-4-deoxy-L-arabinose transferase-like glycosyltransferase
MMRARTSNSSIHLLLSVTSCVTIFLLLRLRWVGHLLTWDEAMNLCSVRSFVSAGNDAFSFWFWRHPPLLLLVSTLLHPLQPGFGERVELLAIMVGILSLGLLFSLNRKVFGLRVALWSCFLISVIPSSIFYDVWFKRDAPVTLFGLAALLLITTGRPWLAGASLGFALLSKETAVFYVAAVLLLWLVCRRKSSRGWKDLAGLLGIPFVMGVWWYVGLKSKVDGIVSYSADGGEVGLLKRLMSGVLEHLYFATGNDRWTANWEGTWLYYFERLPHDLGWLVLLLVLIGLVAMVAGYLRRAEINAGDSEKKHYSLWPLMLLAPALLLLSILPSKVPWVTIAFYPAWATVGAIGIEYVFRSLSSRSLRVAIASGVIIFALMYAISLDYTNMLQHDGSRQLTAVNNSHEIAEAVNRLVSDDERLLITSFYYWIGPLPGYVCPVFTAYLEKKPAVLVRSHMLTFEDYLKDIREHKIDWIVLSPPPGPEAKAMFDQFRAMGLVPCRLRGAFIFRTSSLYGGE